MEPIPKPLLRRLVLTLLVGTGCLFVGAAFYLIEKDTSFFFYFFIQEQSAFLCPFRLHTHQTGSIPSRNRNGSAVHVSSSLIVSI